MKKLLCALLLSVALYAPAIAADTPETGAPKKPVDFTIAATDGYRDVYGPGEQIAFQVAGAAPEPLVVAPNTGFHVQGMIVSEKQSIPFASTNGAYDEEKKAWQMTLTAPNEASDSYRLVLSLYCARDTGPCVDTYGQAAQVQKELTLQVR
jgi:hypothetical protein